MMNDSVREELQEKISSPSKRLHIEMIEEHTSAVEGEVSAVEAEEENVFVARAESADARREATAEKKQPEAERGGFTRELSGAARTSRILVDFQSKNNALPEWRLQMQNAVRRRIEAKGDVVAEKPILVPTATTKGATALKAEAIPQQNPQVGTAILENAVKRVEESRKKFTVHEGSRRDTVSPTPKGGARTFPIAAPSKTAVVPAPSPEPIDETLLKEIVPELPPAADLHTDELPAIPKPEALAETVVSEELKEIESPTEAEVDEALSRIEEYDEFEDIELEIEDEDLEPAFEPVVELKKPAPRKEVSLPLFPEFEEEEGEQPEMEAPEPVMIAEVRAEPQTELQAEPVAVETAVAVAEMPEIEYVEDIHKTTEPEVIEEEVVYEFGDEFSQGFIDDYEYEQDLEEAALETDQNVEDIAPISMRFNAGLLDLLIGTGVSLLLLSPFILSGGKWLSAPGLIAFAVTLAIVMFIYMTASIGFSGRTLGMKVFSLEMIDIEANEYPDFHQAALSSSLYLVSLALGGLGFVTAIFNTERRALHDLLSGTIIVREY